MLCLCVCFSLSWYHSASECPPSITPLSDISLFQVQGFFCIFPKTHAFLRAPLLVHSNWIFLRRLCAHLSVIIYPAVPIKHHLHPVVWELEHVHTFDLSFITIHLNIMVCFDLYVSHNFPCWGKKICFSSKVSGRWGMPTATGLMNHHRFNRDIMFIIQWVRKLFTKRAEILQYEWKTKIKLRATSN